MRHWTTAAEALLSVTLVQSRRSPMLFLTATQSACARALPPGCEAAGGCGAGTGRSSGCCHAITASTRLIPAASFLARMLVDIPTAGRHPNREAGSSWCLDLVGVLSISNGVPQSLNSTIICSESGLERNCRWSIVNKVSEHERGPCTCTPAHTFSSTQCCQRSLQAQWCQLGCTSQMLASL